MIIAITDIPSEGRDLEFELDTQSLNQRANATREQADKNTLLPPEYRFIETPHASLHLELQGETVLIQGSFSGTFISPCSRCAEDIDTDLSDTINVTLKPLKGTASDIEEADDINFGHYDGGIVNCANLVEEELVHRLPFTVTCSASSVEECSKANAHIKAAIKTKEEPSGDDRLAIFKTLKV